MPAPSNVRDAMMLQRPDRNGVQMDEGNRVRGMSEKTTLVKEMRKIETLIVPGQEGAKGGRKGHGSSRARDPRETGVWTNGYNTTAPAAFHAATQCLSQIRYSIAQAKQGLGDPLRQLIKQESHKKQASLATLFGDWGEALHGNPREEVGAVQNKVVNMREKLEGVGEPNSRGGSGEGGSSA